MKDFTELFNKGPVVIFQWKNETHWPVVFITDNVLELNGYSKEELLSGVVSYKEIIHPEDLKRVDREVAEGSRAGVARFSHTSYRIVSRGGTRELRSSLLIPPEARSASGGTRSSNRCPSGRQCRRVERLLLTAKIAGRKTGIS